MSDLLERLRGRGWRMTAQRRVVAEVLDGEHVHLTADEVHARAVDKLPEQMRRCLVLRVYQEMKYREIAALLRLSPELWQRGQIWRLFTYPLAGQGGPSIWFLLELLIAFIQAYIFSVLTAVFINLSRHPH